MLKKIQLPADGLKLGLLAAIESGEVDGDTYSDGEVWVEPTSYARWSGLPAQFLEVIMLLPF
jgi:hypothetical protein